MQSSFPVRASNRYYQRQRIIHIIYRIYKIYENSERYTPLSDVSNIAGFSPMEPCMAYNPQIISIDRLWPGLA